jgi:hypothetical protein
MRGDSAGNAGRDQPKINHTPTMTLDIRHAPVAPFLTRFSLSISLFGV